MTEFNRELPNHIEEYVKAKLNDTDFVNLFEARLDDVDLKSDLTFQEIALLNIISFNNQFLQKKNLNPVYKEFLNTYLRFKISLDRKSRAEFVDINRKDRFEQNLNRFNAFSSLQKVKE